MKRVLMSSNATNSHMSVLEYKKKYLKIYKRVLNVAKRNGTQKDIAKAKNSIKGIWTAVNKCNNNNTRHKGSRIVLKQNNKIITDPNRVAEMFAKQFEQNSGGNNNSSSAVSMLSQNTKRVIDTLNFKNTYLLQNQKLKNLFGVWKIKRPTALMK